MSTILDKNSKQVRAEKVNLTLFEISNAVNTTTDLDQLYKKIHLSLSRIIDTENFYIALYHKEKHAFTIPYFIDQADQKNYRDFVFLKEDIFSLTGLVIKRAKPVYITKQEIKAEAAKLNQEPLGTLPEVWLGVPLLVKKEVIGIMAVQNYESPETYTYDDIDLMSAISDQVTLAIDRKANEESLIKSEHKYRHLVENINEVIYSVDPKGQFGYISSAIESLTGYSPKQFLSTNNIYRLDNFNATDSKNKSYADFIHPDDRERAQKTINEAKVAHKSFQIEYRIIKNNKNIRWVLEKGQFFVTQDNEFRLEGIISDIHERKQAELINSVLFSITNAINTTFNLDELYKNIHNSLARIINVDNFFIAMYDQPNDRIFFPFDTRDEIDDKEEISNASETSALTWRVIKSGKSLLLDRSAQVILAKSLGAEIFGHPAEIWLGVPLLVRNKVIGAMVTQSYDNPYLYSEKDAEVFNSVSEQVAIAIERKQAEEAIKNREQLITALFNISNAVHTSENLDELFPSIHESLKTILDVRNFTIILYDKDTDTLHFKYSVDEEDKEILSSIENASKSSSVTYEVIKTGEILKLDQQEQLDIIERKGGKLLGVLAKSWLGVPLKGKSGVLGAILIQNYKKSNVYQKTDLDILTTVSDQIAIAIEKKQAEELLIQKNTELESSQKIIGSMLNSLPQGLLMVSKGNRVHPNFSAYLHKILPNQKISGEDVMECLFDHSDLGLDSLAQISTTLDLVIGEDILQFELNEHLLVREFKRKLSNGTEILLEVDWNPITDEKDVVEKILIALRDVTEFRQTQLEAESQKLELTMIGEVIGVQQEKFIRFIKSAQEAALENRQILIENQSATKDVVDRLFRNLHTVKGNARIYGLLLLTHKLHEMEQAYADFKNKDELVWDHSFLLKNNYQLLKLLREYENTNDQKLGRKGPGRRGDAEKYLMVPIDQIKPHIEATHYFEKEDLEGIRNKVKEIRKTLYLLGTITFTETVSSIVFSLPDLAASLGKRPPKVHILDHDIHVKNQVVGLLKNIFVHLFRNSLDHGIEPEFERRKVGKSEVGLITISVDNINNETQITYSDDGCGLNPEQIKAKALEKNLIDSDFHDSIESILELIFLPGITTAEKVTDISGRGVGMDAVRDYVERENGKVFITRKDNSDNTDNGNIPFEVKIIFPDKYFLDLKAID